MILVDTSIWIDHLRLINKRLAILLDDSQVTAHRFVTGELALERLKNRKAILNALQDLPLAPLATDGEVLRFIEQNSLYGMGIGYVDARQGPVLGQYSTWPCRDRDALKV